MVWLYRSPIPVRGGGILLVKLTIYAPMIYTAPWIMFWMHAYPFTRASGRGLGPGIPDFFFCLVKWHRADLGPKKLEISRAQPPHTFLINGYALIQNIMQRAV
jgi:hypothetical protein